MPKMVTITIDFDNKITYWNATNDVRYLDLEFIKEELTDYPTQNIIINAINDAIKYLKESEDKK